MLVPEGDVSDVGLIGLPEQVEKECEVHWRIFPRDSTTGTFLGTFKYHNLETRRAENFGATAHEQACVIDRTKVS